MAISRDTARQLVDVVSKDNESKRRVNSWLRFMKIVDSGTEGVIRNYAMAFVGMDPSERDSNAFRWSCDGIAEATAIAINKAVEEKRVPDVKSAEEQARRQGYSHTGTLMNMTDGSRFVFDWWKSLDVSDPWIFRFDDFMDNHQEKGVPYCEFRGWSP